MKYYKTTENKFHAFDDDAPQDFIDKKIEELGLEEITKDYIDSYKSEQALLNHDAEKQELFTLEQYLNSTDYISVKCFELGLNVMEVYPNEIEKRKNARKRINELREIIYSN